METLRIAKMESKSSLLIFTLALLIESFQITAQGLDLEEKHFITMMEHLYVDENSPTDNSTLVPTVPKETLPAVVEPANCLCGEHDYEDSKIDTLECGERPFKDRAPGRRKSLAAYRPPTSAVSLATNANFTDKNQFPWVVALVERKSNGTAVHFCGGTLISNMLVLTATHCFTHKLIKNTEVWINEKNLLLVTQGEHKTQKIKAKRLILHPNYNPVWNYHDISLVELETPVDIVDGSIRPICLPIDEAQEKQDYAYVAGWGQVVQDGPKSLKLKHTCVPLLLRDTCIAHSVPLYKMRITEYMICAGDVKNGGPDACKGDSGGPLFVEAGKASKNRYWLVGIVSWGNGCGRPKRPGVYTRISKYIPWIRQQSKLIAGNQMCSF